MFDVGIVADAGRVSSVIYLFFLVFKQYKIGGAGGRAPMRGHRDLVSAVQQFATRRSWARRCGVVSAALEEVGGGE